MELVEPRKAKLNKKGKWQPKNWDPLYDQMVALSCTGMSNKAIADKFQYTPQQVCNILTSDRGKLIKQLISQHIQDELKNETTARIAQAEKRSHEIIAGVLGNNELLAKHPLAMYDRAIAFLKGRGQLEDESRKVVERERTFVLPSDLAEKLVAGMAKSNAALMLHGKTEVHQLKEGEKRSA